MRDPGRGYCKARLATALGACVLNSLAQATNYTGPLLSVIAQPSPTTPGNTRVSIQTGTSTSCAWGYYSFDLPNASVASTWQAMLMSALATHSQVMVSGSGACDAYNIETVASIYAYPSP